MVAKKKDLEQATSRAPSAVEVLVSSPSKKFDIAAELARARRRAGMSQSQLAERSGVSRNTLMGYESGRNKPGVRELKSICEVLQVTPNRVIFGSEEPFTQKSALEELGVSDEDLESAMFPVIAGHFVQNIWETYSAEFCCSCEANKYLSVAATTDLTFECEMCFFHRQNCIIWLQFYPGITFLSI